MRICGNHSSEHESSSAVTWRARDLESDKFAGTFSGNGFSFFEKRKKIRKEIRTMLLFHKSFFAYEELPRILGISWCSQEDRSDATPNWVSSSHHCLRRRVLLTETRLCDEVSGHGEHMFLVCLVIADGFGIHFGFILATVHTRTLPLSLTVTAHSD